MGKANPKPIVSHPLPFDMLRVARAAEKSRERLDRISRIYRIFAQDAVAGAAMS